MKLIDLEKYIRWKYMKFVDSEKCIRWKYMKLVKKVHLKEYR